mmetsp:Transcript_24374/g.55237  ORF Transcript_24374/g.55237 Transcript_24374/m.55237 type:complete len:202 (-) Transcript_24374:188-793(-)
MDDRSSSSEGSTPVMARGTQPLSGLSGLFDKRTAVLAGEHLTNDRSAHSTVGFDKSSPPSFVHITSLSNRPSSATCSACTDSTSSLVMPFSNTLPAANTPNRSTRLLLASYTASSGNETNRLSNSAIKPTEPRSNDVRSDVNVRIKRSIADRLDGSLLLLLAKLTLALSVDRKEDLLSSWLLLWSIVRSLDPRRCNVSPIE